MAQGEKLRLGLSPKSNYFTSTSDHIITYLSQILGFVFMLKSGKDEEERITLMKSKPFGL